MKKLNFIFFTLQFSICSLFAQNEVNIGSQTWANQNLNVQQFANGDTILQANSMAEWVKYSENKTAAWCYPDFNSENGEKFGKLYNWFAVNDSRGIAPEGWRIPTNQDWLNLKEYLGVSQNGYKLKSKEIWTESYYAGSNEVGFNGFPVGIIKEDGTYSRKSDVVVYWTINSSETSAEKAYTHALDRNQKQVVSYPYDKTFGLSVRCIK